MVTNPKFFGQSTDGTPNQIEDGNDFPHTGLLKALSTASSGRYPVSGFDITNPNAQSFTVANGYIIYNGYYLEVTGDTLTLDATYTNGYHLLVVPKPTGQAGSYSQPTVTLRNPTASEKVAEYLLGDTIIGVITYTGANPCHIQYLTYDKTENSLHIGQNSGVDIYANMGHIYGTSLGMFIEQESALVGGGNLNIINKDADRDIIFTLNDGGVNKSITFDSSDAMANFGVFDVVSNGVVLTGGGLVNNHGQNRLITSGSSNTDLNAESSITFSNVLGQNQLNADAAIIATNNIITDSNFISNNGNVNAFLGSVQGKNIYQSNTVGGGNPYLDAGVLGSNGIRSKGYELAADATQGYNPMHHAYASLNDLINAFSGLGDRGVITPIKENYYIGYDGASNVSNPTTDVSHNGQNAGQVNDPSNIQNSQSEYAKLTLNNLEVENNQDVYGTGYNPEDVFGGGALFIGLGTPDNKNHKTVTLHNITSFALYVVIIDEQANDPSLMFQRNRVNGGNRPSEYFFDVQGNEKCVNLSEILLDSQFFTWSAQGPNATDKYRDAILIKPRESVTLQAMKVQGMEIGTDFQSDVFGQQGLHFTGQNQNLGQWFITSSTGNNGNANISFVFGNSFKHIPVHLTGTAFVTAGNCQLMLPSAPPIGTQYSFLVKFGSTIIHTPIVNQTDFHSQKGVELINQGFYDEYFELSVIPSQSPMSISGGNAKTFIYTMNNNWEIIG